VCDLDGVKDEGEECDDGNAIPCDGCSNSCKIVACGNGRLDTPREECDDGNTLDCDGCHGDCSRSDDVCGDAILECGEPCDPGAPLACDGIDTCSATCTVEGCGNGVQECFEECDDGAENGQPDSRCALDCVRLPPPNCGNATTEAAEGEECDDGNTADCDGCSHLCESEGCGNNVRECLEECDDGNTSPCDGCTPTCRLEECGNGTVDCGEECDDGDQNGLPGSTCLAEVCRSGETCSSESVGLCVPCGDATDCDPLGACAGIACLEGVCTPAPLDCDDAIACTTDGCAPLTGCTHALRPGGEVAECDDGDPCTDPTCTASGCTQQPKSGFDSARCRLDGLETLLLADALDAKARSVLGKLRAAAASAVERASSAEDAGKTAKARRKLRAAAKKMSKFSKKVSKFQPARITDPALGTLLAENSADVLARLTALRDTLAP
jgi:cysteine-rich repeat protein